MPLPTQNHVISFSNFSTSFPFSFFFFSSSKFSLKKISHSSYSSTFYMAQESKTKYCAEKSEKNRFHSTFSPNSYLHQSLIWVMTPIRLTQLLPSGWRQSRIRQMENWTCLPVPMVCVCHTSTGQGYNTHCLLYNLEALTQ